MEWFVKLCEGLATLAWPAIVILLIIMFRPAVLALIESARFRKFTLRIGGQELSMEEVNEQQRNLIADLQTQVLEIKKMVKEPTLQSSSPEAIHLKNSAHVASALWVDDQPKNNSYFIQQLKDKGVRVDLALSTTEGLRLLEKRTYDIILSDMGRTEEETYKSTAGLELLQQIRAGSKTLPFVIFCSSLGVREHKEEAINLGATAITSSPTELFGILQFFFGAKS